MLREGIQNINVLLFNTIRAFVYYFQLLCKLTDPVKQKNFLFRALEQSVGTLSRHFRESSVVG